MTAGGVEEEARRRRTFAIISHPDAGKTTLTEKLLLYGGALREAGQVSARGGRKAAVSDWMEMEQARGISVTSTVLRFEHEGTVFNLLDTPGHRDFSEDTMRVLAAADCAVILLDAARGVQEQTRMLFDVARAREIPLLVFVNKYDRPGMEPLEMLDHIESELGLVPAPLVWPAGEPGRFVGLLDRRAHTAVALERTPHGAQEALETEVDLDAPPAAQAEAFGVAADELELIEGAGEALDLDAFGAGRSTPVLFGSAMWNFGVRQLLAVLDELAPSPPPRLLVDGTTRPITEPFSGQVFKLQANMDARHRDRLAFVRICSGRFEKGMKAYNARTGKPIALNHAHDVFGQRRDLVEEAFPGDVIGISGASDLRVGDTICVTEGITPFVGIPTLAPERLMSARATDATKRKQFRKGLSQLDDEGVVQLIERDAGADPAPILGAVGELQFEGCLHRMANEFSCPIRLEPTQWAVARRIDEADAELVRRQLNADVLHRADGTAMAVFTSAFWLERFGAEHPDVRLDRVLGDTLATTVTA